MTDKLIEEAEEMASDLVSEYGPNDTTETIRALVDRLKERDATIDKLVEQLRFLVDNDSINDSSIDRDIRDLIKQVGESNGTNV